MGKRRRAEVVVVVKNDTKDRAAEAEREAVEPKLKDHRKKARVSIKTEDLDHSGVGEYVKMVGDDICLRCKQNNLDCHRKRRPIPHWQAKNGMLKDFLRCENCVSNSTSTKCVPVSEVRASSTSPRTRSSRSPAKRKQAIPTATSSPPHEDCRCRLGATSPSIPEALASIVDLSSTLMAFDAALLDIMERVDRHDQDLEQVLTTIRKLRQQRREVVDEDDEEDPLLLISEPEEYEAEEGLDVDVEAEVEVC